jgi:hypothetical protein
VLELPMMTAVRNQNNATQSETTESQSNATQPETKASVECEEVMLYHQAGSVMVYTLSSPFELARTFMPPFALFNQPGLPFPEVGGSPRKKNTEDSSKTAVRHRIDS